MIPAEFDYAAPDTLDEALQALADGGEDAKALAGGHSLIPLMRLRLAAPSLLVDLRKIPGLHGVQRENGDWRIGALTPHAQLERAPELGILSRVAATIADPQVRNRGTIGGSLAHGDPASDLPAVLLITEGSATVVGQGGQRSVAAADLFRDYLLTDVKGGEILTEVRVPALQGWGFGYEKFNRRSEDWAMVAVSAVVKQTGDICEDVRVGLTNMGHVPLRATAVEEALRGQPLNAASIARAAEEAAEGTSPPADLNASADYKRHLSRVLCRRALTEAAGLT
jgi:aerobic carbon-monoxide dehydrogenase medium subunit